MLRVEIRGRGEIPLLHGAIGPRHDPMGHLPHLEPPEEITAAGNQHDDADQERQSLDGLGPHHLMPLIASWRMSPDIVGSPSRQASSSPPTN